MGVLVLGEAVCVCVWKNFVSSSQFFSKATATEKKKVYFLKNVEGPGCPSQALCSKNTNYHFPGGDEALVDITS